MNSEQGLGMMVCQRSHALATTSSQDHGRNLHLICLQQSNIAKMVTDAAGRRREARIGMAHA